MEKLLRLFGVTPKWNAHLWKSYWTTKLSALQISLAGAMITYSQLSERVQDKLPDHLIVWLGTAIVVVGFLTPPAAASAQPSLLSDKKV